ncbi:hypothetical protein PMAYCL1PPCAC_08380, partial [Pristionchus mayeri]
HCSATMDDHTYAMDQSMEESGDMDDDPPILADETQWRAEENPMEFPEDPATISIQLDNYEPPKEKPMEVEEAPMADVLSPTVADFPPLSVLSGAVRMCYLCGAVTAHVHATPRNPKERAAFLARVISSKKSDLFSVKALGRNIATAYFCVHHLRTLDEIPQEKQIGTYPLAMMDKPKNIKKKSK